MVEKIRVQIDEELEELVPTYLKNLQKSVDTIENGLKEGDLEQCRFIGHNIKGSGGSYGFNFISTMGEEIELAAKSEDKDSITKCIVRLRDYFKRVDVQYTS